jgi:hypothetical protein
MNSDGSMPGKLWKLRQDIHLVHYSKEPLLGVRQGQQMGSLNDSFKPAGLWFSVDGYPNDMTWPRWCQAEDFHVDCLQAGTEIVLTADHRVLHLSTKDEIRQFQARFRRDAVPKDHLRVIDWAGVAEKFQGIIIAPYCFDARFEDGMLWYYTWDCASGCIGDPAAIESPCPAMF